MYKKSSQMPNKPVGLNNENHLIILGIDPGYGRLGIAVIEKTNKTKETVIFSDCIETKNDEDIYSRFKDIGQQISSLLDEYKPNEVALESLFIAKNQKTAMRVAEVRGIIIYEIVKRGLPIYEYTPLQIKSAVTGDGTSDKTRIIKMIHLLVQLKKKITLDDEYDAIAVALTHSARRMNIK